MEKERGELESKNNGHVDQIRNLRIELEHAFKNVDQSGSNIYDSIEPPSTLGALGGNSQIYNSPVDLRGIKGMTTVNVCDMLREIHLGQYVEKFTEEQVNGELLKDLDDTIMKEDLGMTGLHARKLMGEVKKRK